MKNILLLRHCKSDWSFDEVSDHERPLNQRGKSDATKVGNRLFKLQPSLQKVYVSSAKRAQNTAALVFKNWEGLSQLTSDKLYTFSADDLLRFISSLPETDSDIAIVGHNPAMTDLICQLSHIHLDNLPTGGFCRLEFDVNQWTNIRDVVGKVKYLEFPKMLIE